MRVRDEAGVLVPAELHALLGGLDDVLLVEEIDGVAERRPRDLQHEVGEQELFDGRALAERVDEVPLAAVVEVEGVDAEPIHLAVALVDEALALVPQRLEVAWPDDALEDEEALVAEVLSLLGRDERGGDGHRAEDKRPRSAT